MSAQTVREALRNAIEAAQAAGDPDVPISRLSAVLERPDLPPDTVAVLAAAQAVILWSEGRAIVCSDTAPVPTGFAPVERAVIVARLRALADHIEWPPAEDD